MILEGRGRAHGEVESRGGIIVGALMAHTARMARGAESVCSVWETPPNYFGDVRGMGTGGGELAVSSDEGE